MSSTVSAAPMFSLTLSDHQVEAEARAALLAEPRFGTVFTDHMARIRWTLDRGWHDRSVVPYGPLQLDPATAVLHYGQEIFEGLKAYPHEDGSVWTFRPQANAARFGRSARRLSLPEIPEVDFLDSLRALVSIDRDWVPGGDENSLYLRPFMFASETFLGVRASHEVEYLVIASPVGPYFAGGVRPVSIWVEREYHRAGPGGTGAAKCGGNYAASLLPQTLAHEHGCDQVCYLDATQNLYLEELGGMNIMVVDSDGTVRTPPLNGSILEGVTRSSLLQLLSDAGHEVREEPIALSTLLDEVRSGSVREIFACGTAAVMTPIGRLAGADFDETVGDGQPGPVTMATRAELTDIQYGRRPDRHEWLYRLA
jgi:branched-chain amino acid aminotransferase